MLQFARFRALLIIAAMISAILLVVSPVMSQEMGPVQTILQDNRELIEESSRRTIGPVVEALGSSELERAPTFLAAWQARSVYQRQSDGLFFIGEERDGATRAIDPDSGEVVDEITRDGFSQLRPNGGVRSMIGAALVQFQLSDPDPSTRREALAAIARDAEESHLGALRASLDGEEDPEILAAKQRLERILAITYEEGEALRIAAIESFAGDIGLDVRAALNPLVSARTEVTAAPEPPATRNVARILEPGSEDLSREDAYAQLVAARLAPAIVSQDDIRAALIDNIENGQVGGVSVETLDTQETRLAAYLTLAGAGTVPTTPTEDEIDAALDAHTFFESYAERSSAVTDAANATLQSIEINLMANQALDFSLDALSLGSIYFLAAIGLAITFGVMGVINMAHGEFIMMGAYTGYVVQLFVPDLTLSILIALPLAFAITFGAGVAMERLIIRWLYHRPLETLLATFGISIALQQLAKNIFGTQARPFTAPDWLSGAFVLNDVVSISYIRIAIFVLALVFLAVFLFVMNKTRLGLEVRAVTQNPKMAASMGINPDKINMLTFGFGSGIAGIAGVAIGLFGQVTTEMGQQYIVQSFMTVVVGGVGSVWGTLAGAGMIGGLQKFIEFLNPSNTLAAQTYMILFIILFIQFRPRGIVALKGRAAEM
ncbi:MAG: urea ABC transporter permease subunit UrtB [Hyphomicrobiales bacterium]|jgi:urea transport system permease protein